jgi:hypothetical protein
MDCSGLRFDVRRFCGAPLVAAEGKPEEWQFDALRNLLHAFQWKGHEDLIVDLAGVCLTGHDSKSLLQALKSWSPEMNVHVVATGDIARSLTSSSFPYRMHVCSSLDEAAECVCRTRRTVDDWTQSSTNLPLAA